MEGTSLSDIENLKRQKEELLLKKQAKERHLAELMPENVETLKYQRELILAKKAEKERQLVELITKQDVVTNRAAGGTLSKLGSKKRGRSKREEEDELLTKQQPSFLTPPTSALLSPESKFVLDDRQFDELRKEHKRNRKLIREQYQEFEVLTQYTLSRVDYLQQSLNLIMNHIGLAPVPHPEPFEDEKKKDDMNIEVEVINTSPSVNNNDNNNNNNNNNNVATQVENVPTESLTVPIIDVTEVNTTEMIVEITPENNSIHIQEQEKVHTQPIQEQPKENNYEMVNNNNNINNNINNNNNDNHSNNHTNNDNTKNYSNNNENKNNNTSIHYSNDNMEVVKERAHSEFSDSNNNFNIHGTNEEENKKMMMFNNQANKQENGVRNNFYESHSVAATTTHEDNTNDLHNF